MQLDIYGRGNNAYRWAGETDVFEAVDNFLAVERLLGRDRCSTCTGSCCAASRWAGPAPGTWACTRPTAGASSAPGAGFTTTHGYVKDLPDKLPDYQEACLHIYDAVDYAENAFDVRWSPTPGRTTRSSRPPGTSRPGSSR